MTTKISLDSDENLDYTFDYSRVLEADTIQSSTWTKTQGDTNLNVLSPSFTTNTTTIWLSGGRLGSIYKVTNHVVMTPSGREFDRTLLVKIVEK